jgi:hypothetical protein
MSATRGYVKKQRILLYLLTEPPPVSAYSLVPKLTAGRQLINLAYDSNLTSAQQQVYA